MSKALWIAQKLQLRPLIRKMSDLYGGDEGEYLNEFYVGILQMYPEDLSEAITCFTDLVKDRTIELNRKAIFADIDKVSVQVAL